MYNYSYYGNIPNYQQQAGYNAYYSSQYGNQTYAQPGYQTSMGYLQGAYTPLPVNTSMNFNSPNDNSTLDAFQLNKSTSPQQNLKTIGSSPLANDETNVSLPIPLQAEGTPSPETSPMATADQSTAANAPKQKKVDVFRDTPLRYAGYLNETGEAFKEFIPKLAYTGSYRLTTAYVWSDSIHKAIKGYRESKSETVSGKLVDAFKKGADCYAFQYIASEKGPVIVVNRMKPYIGRALDSVFKNGLKTTTRNLGVSSISLGIILASVPLIDRATHTFLNFTVRPLLGLPKVTHHGKDKPHQPQLAKGVTSPLAS